MESSEITHDDLDDKEDFSSAVRMKEHPKSYFDFVTKKNAPSFIIQGELPDEPSVPAGETMSASTA